MGNGNWQYNLGNTHDSFAVDSGGKVYVVDSNNNRTRKFESETRLATDGLATAYPGPYRLSRRAGILQVVVPRRPHPGPLHVVEDATGERIHGEGK